MCRCLYKTLPLFHALLSIYEVICGIIRLAIFFASINKNSSTYGYYPYTNQTTTTPSPELQQIPQIEAAFIIDWISSLLPTTMGIFICFIFIWLGFRMINLCRTNANCRIRQLISSKSIQRFLLFNCNCPCYIARPKWRFLIRCLFISVSIALRLLAIILYASAPTYNNPELASRTKQLASICAMTLPSTICTLLLDYYHYRVWWHYVPALDLNPFYRSYLRKHKRFIPYHLMGEYRNEMQLWNEPCALQQYCPSRKLEHILIFHFNTHTPTPRWSDIPNKDPLTTTYIGFHRTSPTAAIGIAYEDFRLSTVRPQMLGFGIYFARSIYHTQFKARHEGAIICAEVLMGRVLEITNDELNNVSNTNAWHAEFDTIYYRHPREPLRDEFCVKSNEQILRWVMCIEQQFDPKVHRYGLDTEFMNTQCFCI